MVFVPLEKFNSNRKWEIHFEEHKSQSIPLKTKSSLKLSLRHQNTFANSIMIFKFTFRWSKRGWRFRKWWSRLTELFHTWQPLFPLGELSQKILEFQNLKKFLMRSFSISFKNITWNSGGKEFDKEFYSKFCAEYLLPSEFFCFLMFSKKLWVKLPILNVIEFLEIWAWIQLCNYWWNEERKWIWDWLWHWQPAKHHTVLQQ